MDRRQRIVLLGLAAAVAIVAVVVAGTGGGDDEDVVDTRTGTVPTIVVRDAQPVGGVRTLRYRKGATIAFAVRSDTADEIHLHGYDVGRDIRAGGTVRFSVPARIDGRFEVELEKHGTQIASVEVLP